jgi:phage-related tail fiber protein
MLFNSINVVEGSEIQSAFIQYGSSFPVVTPNPGQLFFITNKTGPVNPPSLALGLYIFDVRQDGNNQTVSSWKKVLQNGDPSSLFLPPIVIPSTYRMVTVNNQGLVTSGANPTTLTEYGIVDAQPLNSNLTAIGATTGNAGLLRKTAANTWSLDTNSYLTGNQTITIGGDVAGSGTTAFNLTLSNTGVGAGTYGSASSIGTFQVDAKGRIIAASSVTIAINASSVTAGTFADARVAESNVTQHQAALSINESQIVNGTILARNAGNETITGSWNFTTPVVGAEPTQLNHFTTKSYVDNIASGVQPLKSVRAATTANISLFGIQAIDGINLAINDRVLVKDQGTGSQNGIYTVASGTWTRATDFDGNPSTEVTTGSLVFVESGISNGNSSWILVTTGTIIVGTTSLEFSVFSRAGDYIAGAGLTRTGNTFNVGTASASRIVVGADAIDLATTGVTAGTYTVVTVDAYGRVTGGQANQQWSGIVNTPTTLAGYGILDGQPNNSTLTAISGVAGNGILVKTGSGAAAVRTISVSGNGLSITNGDGVGGNIAISSNAVSANTASSIVYRDASGNFAAGTVTASLSGNASTATALATGRTFSLTGDVSGTSAAFNGTANATIAVTLPNINSNTGTFAAVTVNTKGQVTSAAPLNVEGDVSGISSGSNLVLNLTNAGNAGTYGSASNVPIVTTDAKGRVIGATTTPIVVSWSTGVTNKPTTLAGYGITDGVSSSNIGTMASQNASNVNITGGSVMATSITTMGLTRNSVDVTLTAVGNSITSALGLTKDINQITAGAAGTGVRLPNSIGSTIIIINSGPNAILVYPFAGSASIDTSANGAAVSLPPGARIMYIQISATQYFTLNATYA